MGKINLVVKGNLVSNKIDKVKSPVEGGGRQNEYSVVHSNDNLNGSCCDNTIIQTDNVANYDISEAIIIEGDLSVDAFYYNGVVLVTGHVIMLGGGESCL